MYRKFYIILTLLLLAAGTALPASVKISVTPSRAKRSIEVGDQFYLNIQVSDIDAEPAKPSSMPGGKLMYFDRTGQSSSFTSVNGHTSQSYSYTYTGTFRAEKEGSFSFGPITVGGVKSNVAHYTIGKAGSNASSMPGAPPTASRRDASDDGKPQFIGKGDGNLFLRASVSNVSPYEQQAVIYTVKLYTQYDAIKFIGATAAPKFDGFVTEESKDISTSLSYETYQGKTYATAVIARYIIFPQMTGKLKITGNTYTVSVDRREYYHDSFFGTMSYATPLQLNVTPNDLTVDVKALPSPRPADFSGGVGSFSISSDLRSSDLKTNQAASIVYKIAGTGNLKYIQMPDLSALYPPQVEVYSPKIDQKVSVSGSNTSGFVTYDYSFMPLEEGDFRIPDVRLVYFNPSAGRYETAVAKGRTIHVGKGKASARSQSLRKLRFNPDLQKVSLSDLRKTRTPYINSFAFWLWYIIPFLMLVSVYVALRRYVSLHADMTAFNARRADKLARRRLKRAASALRRNDDAVFYTELLKALWGYVGDKLKMPTSELMRDNIRQVMEERGVDAANIDAFIAMIDDAEFAKYSSSAATSTPAEFYSRAADLINTLEKSFKKD